MAKWGKGDPRWIVEKRADATNVNNWHWTERNATGWSKNLLQSILVDLLIEGEEGTCRTTKVTEITGEASANNRKGKLFFFYEFVIKIKWSGHTLTDPDNKCTGSIEVVNLSDENDIDSIDVVVETKKTTTEAYALKELIIRKGVAMVKEQLAIYIKKLKEEFSQGMVLPTQNTPNVSNSKSLKTVTPPQQRQAPVVKPGNHGYRIPTKKLTIVEEFKTTADDLYFTLTDPERVKAFTDDTATVEPFRGGKFSLFNGNIHGEYVQLERNEKIVQKWRSKGWPEGKYVYVYNVTMVTTTGHFSMVTMEIHEQEDQTQLKLIQSEIPDDQYERTQDGWRKYYFECMKTTFGYGARLL